MPAEAIDSTPVVAVFFTRPVASAPKNWAPPSPESVVPCAINLFEKVMLALPSKLLPARYLAVANFVAVPALPVTLPVTVPVTLPVTLPVIVPVTFNAPPTVKSPVSVSPATLRAPMLALVAVIFPTIPTPPATRSAPVITLLLAVVLLTYTGPVEFNPDNVPTLVMFG